MRFVVNNDVIMKGFTSTMVALFPPPSLAAKLADAYKHVKGVPKAADFHGTLLFLGCPPVGQAKAIEDAVRSVASKTSPFAAKISGVGRFSHLDKEGRHPLYVSYDAKGLAEFRQQIVKELASRNVASPSEHDFTPHITIGGVKGQHGSLPKPIEASWLLEEVYVVFGETRKVIKFGEPVPEEKKPGSVVLQAPAHRRLGPDNEETSSIPGHSEEETSSPEALSGWGAPKRPPVEAVQLASLGEESVFPLLTSMIYPATIQKSEATNEEIVRGLTQYLLAHKQSFHIKQHFGKDRATEAKVSDLLSKALTGKARLADMGLIKADIREAALALYGVDQ